MTFGYLDCCPRCGSERGPGGHECLPRDCVDVERMREAPSPPLPPPSKVKPITYTAIEKHDPRWWDERRELEEKHRHDND